MVRSKICGVTNEADLRAVAESGADAVGIVTEVSVDTPREVAPDRAADLVAAAPPFLSTVLVAMPDSATRAVELAGAVAPDAIQLHGEFDDADIRYVRRETRADVITAVDAADTDRVRRYDGVADAILLDSTTDDGAGGTGETHDWDAARALIDDCATPVVLAGGLTPENVADAVRTVDPYAVDVSSGVERSGGEKDHEAVRSFVRNAAVEVSA
ncbi:phosphoribosylanthranilate isomerase [Haloplanus aerogenes]|uniref:N-(5'-phosphoribosyl)anthranilate isomerase n=1 Tax=Haloplanus aerogenes TaxID=660522 RepID=A0A3M0DAM2_9EURY|nr:phosphoribosylanthranilate isomerase [Haloplanus aerogenes]AZH26229.1 phosphoribosylanthranilate isomerase [Haloplanus aerogenes]RMB18315.1 phosphoribosylanthranilate isomerase [Haloplanus aerogenes]